MDMTESLKVLNSKLDKIISDYSEFKDTIYKWGLGLAAGTIVIVTSIVNGLIYYFHLTG